MGKHPQYIGVHELSNGLFEAEAETPEGCVHCGRYADPADAALERDKVAAAFGLPLNHPWYFATASK